MQKIRIAFAITFSAFFIGCPVRSLQPLFQEKDLSFNSALIGKWADGEDLYTFKRSSGNNYEIFLSEKKPVDSTGQATATADTITFVGQLGRVGKNWFLDSYPAREAGDFHLLPTHIISKVWFDGDTIQIASLEGDWIKKMAKTNRLTLQFSIVDGDVILTGSTMELQEVMRSFGNDNDAFPNPAKFVRVK